MRYPYENMDMNATFLIHSDAWQLLSHSFILFHFTLLPLNMWSKSKCVKVCFRFLVLQRWKILFQMEFHTSRKQIGFYMKLNECVRNLVCAHVPMTKLTSAFDYMNRRPQAGKQTNKNCLQTIVWPKNFFHSDFSEKEWEREGEKESDAQLKHE